MPNPYVNKVQKSDGTTIIDISDTTAVASDVAEGKYFYLATGQKVIGTATGGGGGYVTQDANGFIILPATGDGGGGGGYTLADIFTGAEPHGLVTYAPSADIPAYGIAGRSAMTELVLNMGNNEFVRNAINNNTALTRIIINKDADSTKGVTDYSISNNSALKQIITRGRISGWGQSSLRGNGALEVIDIEDSGGQLSNNMFYGSGNNFKSLILRQDSVVPITVQTFTNTPFSGENGAKVFVPSSTIATYQTSSNWSTLYSSGYLEFVALGTSIYASKTWYA